MKKNIGLTDRLIRVIVAIIICFLYLNESIDGLEGGLLLIEAVIFVFTSLTGISPLYKLLGLSTDTSVQED